jgi:hypothetical protein
VKTNAGQPITKIQSSAAQMWNTLAIDKKLHSIALDYNVAFLFCIERHLVLKPRTAAFCNLHAQTFAGAFCLRPKQSSQLSNSAVSDINHHSTKYGCGFTKSKKPQMHRTPFFFAIRTLKSKIKANEPD